MKPTVAPPTFTRKQISDLERATAAPRPFPTAPAMRPRGAVLLSSIVGRTLSKKEGS